MNILWVKKKLFPGQSRIIKRHKFTYLPLLNTFGKQTKTIEEQGNNKRFFKKLVKYLKKLLIK